MRVQIKTGGDGVLCWNGEAINAYAATVNDKEARLGQHNPDLKVMPGQVSCYGCEVMEYDYGTKCTARLVRTRYGVEGEIEPRAEDANGSLGEIPGLLTRAPENVAAAPTLEPVPPERVDPAQNKKSGLRGLFGR